MVPSGKVVFPVTSARRAIRRGKLCETTPGRTRRLDRSAPEIRRACSAASMPCSAVMPRASTPLTPISLGAPAGLNFEHITPGHSSPDNLPRHTNTRCRARPGPLAMRRLTILGDLARSANSGRAARPPFPLPGARLLPCSARRYAVLFFANYMNDVAQVAIHFLGRECPAGPRALISADAPAGHADYNGGGTYRASVVAL